MSGSYTECNFENGVMSLFREELGYQTRRGAEVERDYREPFSEVELWQALRRVNPNLPDEALDDAVRKIRHIEIGTLTQRNKEFTDYLQNGVEVRYFERGEERYARAYLLDYRDPENNEFVAVNQWNYVENGLTKRFDVVVYVNALPLVVVELKSPVRDGVDASSAYRQLRNYIADVPNFFVYNAFCVMSDMVQSKVGTITSPETRFAEWKSENGERRSGETTGFTPYYVLFRGLFEKRRFLDLVKNFVCFASDGRSDVKILAGYHQYFAVKKAVESTRRARELGDGKGGVFWHTQGSGKSFSMTFYAKAIQDALDSPTLVVLTDRNDLDDQLFQQFTKCRDFCVRRRSAPKRRRACANFWKGEKRTGFSFRRFISSCRPTRKTKKKEPNGSPELTSR
ncbi:MAG: type I restriction endonuclease subunit R [Thermoguttaceae bacterium]|nr:type I restriction endonuclease subunit R [Thermoguttaceae bacterium]